LGALGKLGCRRKNTPLQSSGIGGVLLVASQHDIDKLRHLFAALFLENSLPRRQAALSKVVLEGSGVFREALHVGEEVLKNDDAEEMGSSEGRGGTSITTTTTTK
jgi:hypothetical protein